LQAAAVLPTYGHRTIATSLGDRARGTSRIQQGGHTDLV